MFEIQQFGERKSNSPHLLVVGGVHGDEPPGVDAATELANRLKGIPVQGLITVVPIVNRPAWESRTRCGPDGLDLARTCPGREEGSVTERIAAAVSKLIAESTALIDLHSGGHAMDIYPLTGYMMIRDASVLAQQRNMASAFSLPIIWGTSAEFDGRTLSIAREHRIPAIYAEFGSAQSDPGITDTYAKGCLRVAAALGLFDLGLFDLGLFDLGLFDLGLFDQVTGDSPATKPVVVEETSTGSGHLQICHPSPCEGQYESCVELGDDIVAGESLGSVICAATGERFNVAAEKSGKLIVRRVISSVQRGDSLGVILKTT